MRLVGCDQLTSHEAEGFAQEDLTRKKLYLPDLDLQWRYFFTPHFTGQGNRRTCTGFTPKDQDWPRPSMHPTTIVKTNILSNGRPSKEAPLPWHATICTPLKALESWQKSPNMWTSPFIYFLTYKIDIQSMVWQIQYLSNQGLGQIE